MSPSEHNQDPDANDRSDGSVNSSSGYYPCVAKEIQELSSPNPHIRDAAWNRFVDRIFPSLRRRLGSLPTVKPDRDEQDIEDAIAGALLIFWRKYCHPLTLFEVFNDLVRVPAWTWTGDGASMMVWPGAVAPVTRDDGSALDLAFRIHVSALSGRGASVAFALANGAAVARAGYESRQDSFAPSCDGMTCTIFVSNDVELPRSPEAYLTTLSVHCLHEIWKGNGKRRRLIEQLGPGRPDRRRGRDGAAIERIPARSSRPGEDPTDVPDANLPSREILFARWLLDQLDGSLEHMPRQIEPGALGALLRNLPHLDEALAQLPPKRAYYNWLFHVRGLSTSQIAQKCGCCDQNISNNLRNGWCALKKSGTFREGLQLIAAGGGGPGGGPDGATDKSKPTTRDGRTCDGEGGPSSGGQSPRGDGSMVTQPSSKNTRDLDPGPEVCGSSVRFARLLAVKGAGANSGIGPTATTYGNNKIIISKNHKFNPVIAVSPGHFLHAEAFPCSPPPRRVRQSRSRRVSAVGTTFLSPPLHRTPRDPLTVDQALREEHRPRRQVPGTRLLDRGHGEHRRRGLPHRCAAHGPSWSPRRGLQRATTVVAPRARASRPTR
jgi:DNA-directed RNA polymerase specialized sigma24 family protein